MKLFDPNNHTCSKKHEEIYAFYALIYTIVDFSAAIFFIGGSILFFYESTTYIGTWLFLIGSIFFALRPTTRLLRELAYIRAGKYEEIKVS
ncbi:MAG: N-acetyl-gamma-glutamyl-phosphate reductase [Sneathiella sp.]|uniref:YrhK family protein n=1 Tax=Sneathiella sp. TaxID=1964365 RepID=UPI000C491138|nr:YrhK family protein [Sneathiella sp.]MAZ04273.1 N-acetyl-gamma-glutamyl-phosphate reductase [Sneathiella sp.]|tara:strand:- start:1174 stop:1446 length:273 start_codon:yes stop_codon:yes gene_type:complete